MHTRTMDGSEIVDTTTGRRGVQENYRLECGLSVSRCLISKSLSYVATPLSRVVRVCDGARKCDWRAYTRNGRARPRFALSRRT